jgi:hypothetical protein
MLSRKGFVDIARRREIRQLDLQYQFILVELCQNAMCVCFGQVANSMELKQWIPAACETETR